MDEVWKTTEWETYRNKPAPRKVITWTARINGKIVKGFSTKRAALAAINKKD